MTFWSLNYSYMQCFGSENTEIIFSEKSFDNSTCPILLYVVIGFEILKISLKTFYSPNCSLFLRMALLHNFKITTKFNLKEGAFR